jgi:SAM-dependent methyltransferase
VLLRQSYLSTKDLGCGRFAKDHMANLMSQPPRLFDRTLLCQRRKRAAGRIDDHDFLYRRAGEEIRVRLDAINRSFPLAVDLGAQHGALTRALRGHPSICTLISAEPSPALLSRCPQPRLACDEESLPFAPASLDLVVSALSLHMLNDIPGSLAQIRRALKPDGLFLAAAMGGQTLHELRACLMEAESEMENGASPRVSPMADVRDYGALLQRAGFALPVADADPVRVTYGSIFALIADLRGMGATNVLHERARKPLGRRVWLRAAEIYAMRFPAGEGRIAASFEIIYLSGWAPHASQQKPLPPGSARIRLADALGVAEHSAGDQAAPLLQPKKPA